LYYRADEPEILTKSLEKRIMHNISGSFIYHMILLRLLVSRFLLPAVSSPQTENTRCTYASDAGADSRSRASGANSGYLFMAFVTQKFLSLRLNLHTLKYRRLRGDMIEVFKIVHNVYDNRVAPSLSYYNTSVTRGNN